jgi:hypothetical protein
MANLFKTGDLVRIIAGSVYENTNKEVPKDILNLRVYIRNVKDGNIYTVARAKTGPVLGDIAELNLEAISTNVPNFNTYLIYIPNQDFPLYHSPSKNSGVIRRINRGLYTIVDEKNGFGKIKAGTGWVELSKVRVM